MVLTEEALHFSIEEHDVIAEVAEAVAGVGDGCLD